MTLRDRLIRRLDAGPRPAAFADNSEWFFALVDELDEQEKRPPPSTHDHPAERELRALKAIISAQLPFPTEAHRDAGDVESAIACTADLITLLQAEIAGLREQLKKLMWQRRKTDHDD
jgi:hypothetical protein